MKKWGLGLLLALYFWGFVLGQTNYYWNGSGAIHLVTSWGTNLDGSGSNPPNFTTANQIFNIQSGQSATLGSSWTISGSGSKLKVLSGGIFNNGSNNPTLTIDMESGGLFIVSSSYTNVAFGSLDVNSTVRIDANNFRPTLTYPNLIFNFTPNYNPGTTNLNINGSFTINSGMDFRGTNTGTPTHTIGGNIIINSGGQWTTTNGSGAPIYNISGTITNNGVISAPTANGTAIINLNGSNSVTVGWGTKNGHDHNINIASGKSVTFADNFIIEVGTLTVNGTLDCGSTAIVSGSGTFTLSSGATIKTAHANGLSTTGSIQTTTRNFNSGANYEFRGAATGTFTTTPTGSTVNNLTINNTGGNVNLDQLLNVTGTLGMTAGKLVLGTNNLTIGSSGSISGASSSNYVVINNTGKLKRNSVGSTTVSFPVGDDNYYTPVTLNNVGTVDNFVVGFTQVPPVCFDAAKQAVSVTGTWDIAEDNPGGSVSTITIDIGSVPTGASFNLPDAGIAHCSGSTVDYVSGTNVTGTVVTGTGFTSFSPFGVGNKSELLPIELAYFQGNLAQGYVHLTWRTYSEISNEFFSIEKSTDGKHFKEIGRIPGGGTSFKANNYHFIDEAPAKGVNYYQLRQVDYDGRSSLSPTVTVFNASGQQNLSIYPTYVSHEVWISRQAEDEGEETHLSFYDQQGRLLSTQTVQLGTGAMPIAVDHLPSGSYILKAQSGKVIEMGRFFKN